MWAPPSPDDARVWAAAHAGSDSHVRAQAARLYQTWEIFDNDDEAGLSEQEFRRALKLLGIKVTTAEWNALITEFDTNADGDFDKDELKAMIELPIADEDDGSANHTPLVRCLLAANSLLQTVGVQTMLYLAFVCVFQLLTTSLRLKVLLRRAGTRRPPRMRASRVEAHTAPSSVPLPAPRVAACPAPSSRPPPLPAPIAHAMPPSQPHWETPALA